MKIYQTIFFRIFKYKSPVKIKSFKQIVSIPFRIASENNVKMIIQQTNEDMEIAAKLQYIEENELFPAPPETNKARLKSKIPTIAIMG